MKTIISALVLLFPFCIAFPQTVKPVNSGELISEGIKLHDEKKYEEAAAVYRKVPRNDTNYVQSLYELAYTLSSDSSYREALQICNEGLAKEDSEYELDFLVLRANIIDDMGDGKRALELYDSALMKYPNYQGLFLNKAITLIHLEKNEEAEEVLKELLLRNPYYSSAHFRLGNLALEKGQLIPAIMCYYTYLLISPEGPYSSSCINLLAAISKGTDDAVQYVSKRNIIPEGNFALVEQIITSKIALDKNYKVLTSLDDPIIRQLQVMMEKLEYEEDNPDFFMQFYVPYIKDIFNKKLLSLQCILLFPESH
jgi:tetratricopeptide (TPR) repeat protein